MKKLLTAVVLASSMFLVGCGGDPCTAASKCSADPKPTDAQIQACKDANANTSAKCYSQNKAFADCFRNKQVCTSANVTDAVATLAACSTEAQAVQTCESM
ncbi:MAG: hypothetical protein AB1938_10115 [Myxococcota bacterium]